MILISDFIPKSLKMNFEFSSVSKFYALRIEPCKKFGQESKKISKNVALKVFEKYICKKHHNF